MYRLMKRIFDMVSSFFGLVVLSPLLIVVAVLIKGEDGGPVFYRGLRVGLKGKEFRTFKFRTMVTNAEKVGGPSTSDDDPRITKVGKVVRKYKIDELPQLIDVLRGTMSIVGPRPEVQSEVETYSEEEKKIFSVKPGITDWSSLKFHDEGEILRGSDDPHETYKKQIKPEKIRLQLSYVEKMSFLTDLKIIFKTLGALVETRHG